MTDPKTGYLRLVAMGVPKPYASQIARGVRRPSLRLAVKIFQATGLRFGPLVGLSEKDIAAASRIAPDEAA